MNQLTKRMKQAWTAGKRIAIDESMVKYKGRSVTFVQYMPQKPIKHGIKIFAVCCANTAVLLGCEVYTGKGNTDVDQSSSESIVLRLINNAGLTSAMGRVLYIDNWYTSISLAKYLYEKYKWLVNGTITPTDKKTRSGDDIPFLKLSNGALLKVKRGWNLEF